MKRRITISTRSRTPAIIITREAIKREKLVYIAIANKPVKYGVSRKKSRIVYIGTTEKGINRIARSGAHRAKELLNERSIKELKFYVVFSRKGKQRVESTWEKLERVLIQAFKDKYY